MMDQVKIGMFISEQRKKQNLTQLELADKLGITDRAICELLGNWITKHRLCDSIPSLLRAVPAQYCYLFLGYTDTFITSGFDNPFIGIVIFIPFSFLYILIILYAPTESELYTMFSSLYNPLLILLALL